MSEQIDLTSPDQAVAGTVQYYIAALLLDRDSARVEIRLNSPRGIQRAFTFTGNDALAFIKAMNKRNASIVSNEKWTLTKLITNGDLNGTVSGVPD